MGAEGFARVKPGQGQEAAVIVDEFEHGRRLGLAGQPARRRGVVLPELADLLALPATHRLGRLLVAGVRGEVVRHRPAAHGGAVQPQGVAAVDFRSGKAAGGRRPGTQELAQQHEHVGWPSRARITPGAARLPLMRSAQRAETPGAAVKHVAAAAAHAEFRRGVRGCDGLGAEAGEAIPHERGRVAGAQLLVDFSSASRPHRGAHAFAAQLVLLCLPTVLL